MTKQNTGQTIKKNEIILPKTTNNFMEVRQIVVEGTDFEIGEALGKIAQKNYAIKLLPYSKPEYKTQRMSYLKEYYPALYERSIGIAQAYGLPADNNFIDCMLVYDIIPMACSVVYFPKEFTSENQPIIARNDDFYLADISQFMGLPANPKEHDINSRVFVLEMYPKDGYPNISLGSLELLSGGIDGINSEGLTISGLSDQNAFRWEKMAFDNEKGISLAQLMHLVLEKAKNIEEAQDIIMQNTGNIYMVFDGTHYLISDRSGKTVIVEFSDDNMKPVFTESSQTPQIMTNHSVAKFQNVADFPSTNPAATYNTFNRYKKLSDYINQNQGKKYSVSDGFALMDLVRGNCNDKSEGPALDMPLRTLWQSVMCLNDCSLQARFYLNDGPNKSLNFSPIFKFILNKQSEL